MPVEHPAAMRLAILAGHQSFAEALQLALPRVHQVEIVARATSISKFVELCSEHRPDVGLVDYWLHDGNALDCADRLRHRDITMRLIAIASPVTPVIHRHSLDAGIEKVLSKNATLRTIANAVLSPGLSIDALSVSGVKPIEFSRRQQQVLELMGQGMDTATIADVLFVSIHTARGHVKKILGLLQERNQLAAVTRAAREGYMLPAWAAPPDEDVAE